MHRLFLFTLTLCNTTICMQSKNAPTTVVETCYLVIMNDTREQVEVYTDELDNNSKYRHKSLKFTNEVTSHHINNSEKRDKRLEKVKGFGDWRIVIHKYSKNSKPPMIIYISNLYEQKEVS